MTELDWIVRAQVSFNLVKKFDNTIHCNLREFYQLTQYQVM